MTETNIVASTILKQLCHGPVGRLVAMIGAHTFVAGAYNVAFRFKARAKNGSNCVKITLGASDTYRVEFVSLRGVKATVKAEFSDVYAEDLKPMFERETGLYLSL
jgi:hypothetical protein